MKKSLDKWVALYYNTKRRQELTTDGGIAQLVRAPALQAGGHRFESCCPHHHFFGLVVQLVRTLACHARGRGFESHPGRQYMYASVAQSVEQGTENPRVIGSIPIGGTIYADLAHLVERHLAKVEVASSSLVIRSIFLSDENSSDIRYLSQVVRQRSAKPLCPGSNPGGASKNPVHVSGRDFYFLLLTSSLLLQIKFARDFWEVISKK